MIVVVTLAPVFVLRAVQEFETSLPTIVPEDFLMNQTIHITDRDGVELYRTYQDEDRVYVPIHTIPPVVYNAFIAIEDERFYDRPCIDLRGLLRAVYKTYFLEDKQGGSTITQQLVRSITEERDGTIYRKVREIVAACKLEEAIGKVSVLEQYVNRINFGGTLYGIQSASRAFYGLPVEQLDAAHAAILAAIVQRPSFFAPGGRLKSVPDRAFDVLASMRRLRFITQEDYTKAVAKLSSITFQQPEASDHPPYPFIFEALQRVDDVLASKNLSISRQYAGLTIQTTIQSSIQTQTEQAILSVFPEISKRTFAVDVAVIVMDRQSRDILAYVGNSDWGGNPETKWVDIASAPRQLGSTFKPIVYAAYFENGNTPDSFVSDSPLQIGSMKPKNFEGGFLGRMTIRKAIAWSRNIPAIRAFLDIGEERILQIASAMGAPTPLLERDRRRKMNEEFSYGWPMAIGSAELPLIELVQAYGTIAEGGVAMSSHMIASISAADGSLLYRPPHTARKQILQPQNADMLADVLRDWNARPERWNTAIDLPRDWNVGLKTGTSNICRIRKFDGNCASYGVLNTVAIGFTDSYVIGVLVTNANNSPLQADADGLNAAVPLWTAIIRTIAENR